MGLLDGAYEAVALKPLEQILAYTDGEDSSAGLLWHAHGAGG